MRGAKWTSLKSQTESPKSQSTIPRGLSPSWFRSQSPPSPSEKSIASSSTSVNSKVSGSNLTPDFSGIGSSQPVERPKRKTRKPFSESLVPYAISDRRAKVLLYQATDPQTALKAGRKVQRLVRMRGSIPWIVTALWVILCLLLLSAAGKDGQSNIARAQEEPICSGR